MEYTHEVSRTKEPTESRVFAHVDNKGRAIGAKAYKWTFEAAEGFHPEYRHGFRASRVPVGTNFAFEPSATRGGESFGACQETRFFRTAAERDAAVAKYFADAEKRAAKTAAKKSRA